MTLFAITAPGRILFGRAEAAKAPALIRAFGGRILIVHGASGRHAPWLSGKIAALGGETQGLPCPGEPTLEMLENALYLTRGFEPQAIVALGGGAVLDLGKALAALIPAPEGPMEHLEVAGKGRPLTAAPLPFIAIPTTAGTGAEVTKNAVIGVPGRKVSLRDDRMVARIAIVDPALTDTCPRDVTLASGLDAVVQVIEPFLSPRATPYTDALCRDAIPRGLAALAALMRAEDRDARDDMAWVSLCGGLALANAGLGAVHGLAGVIGGLTGAAHGAICGALLPHVLAMNLANAPGPRGEAVLGWLAGVFGPRDPVAGLARWIHAEGLPHLSDMGVATDQHAAIATASLAASSMKANPFPPDPAQLCAVLRDAG
jgi:alcohol dehydrogenase class IV